MRRAIHGLAAALAASAALLGSALAQLTVMVSWADWCGACRILGPKLDAAAARFAGKVELIFIDFTDLSEANMERQFDRARPLRPEDFMDGPYLKTGFAYILVDGRLAGEISAGMAVADIVAALEEAQD